MLLKGTTQNGGNPKHIHLKSKFLISKPKENENGNRNVRMEGVKVKNTLERGVAELQTQNSGKISFGCSQRSKVQIRCTDSPEEWEGLSALANPILDLS